MPKQTPHRKDTRRAKKTYTVGIDLGGTKVAAALVDSQGTVVHHVTKPTVPEGLQHLDPRKAQTPPKASDVRNHIAYVVNAMADAAREALEPLSLQDQKTLLVGVGLASAGPMNIGRGTLEKPSNFTGWKSVPLVELFREALLDRKIKVPVSFQNDAMAAALGEGWVGRASDCQTFAMITVGTGIGTGVIFNGRPAQSSGMGSEWGHLMVNAPGATSDTANFYDRSVEGLASGTGLIRRAKAMGFKGNSASDLAAAAKKGDRLAKKVFQEGSEALAALFYGLSLGLNPDLFVVSGGMLAIRQHFLPQAISLYRELIRLKNPLFLTPIQISKLGTFAGVIGAARLPYLEDGRK